VWYLAHRLELTIKNALTGTVFDHMDDMLTVLVYLYSKWVSHKIDAMKLVLSKFGMYTNHIASLIDYKSCKLKGYVIKWTDAKYLLGCALFVDLLTPCAIFSKYIQEDELNLLAALTFLLRTIKETDKLSSKSLK